MTAERLNTSIDAFLVVLRSSWTAVQGALLEKGAASPDAMCDWVQANWEMIVEAGLTGEAPLALEVYGAGADCNEASSRVWNPAALPSHAVVVLPGPESDLLLDHISGRRVLLTASGVHLEEFVTLTENEWYVAMPPFDCVLIEMNGVPVVFRKSDVRLGVSKLETDYRS